MKDPAFLFYSNDFLSGTMLMTDEEIGQYIKLLCLQHQKGHLKEKDMLNICKTYNEEIFSKFKKDEEGNYYNERLDEEIVRRKKYSESRRNNRKKKDTEEEKETTCEEDMKNICNSYEEHMETETVTITKDININNKDNRGMGEEGKKKKIFIPPKLEEVENYVKEKKLNINAKEFLDYFEAGNWIDSKGNKVKNWKQKMLTWNNFEKGGTNGTTTNNTGQYKGIDLSQNRAKYTGEEIDDTGLI